MNPISSLPTSHRGPVHIVIRGNRVEGEIEAEGVVLRVGYACGSPAEARVRRAQLESARRSPFLAAFAADLDGFSGAAFVETRAKCPPSSSLPCDPGAELTLHVEVERDGSLSVVATRFHRGRVVREHFGVTADFSLMDAHAPAAVLASLVPLERSATA